MPRIFRQPFDNRRIIEDFIPWKNSSRNDLQVFSRLQTYLLGSYQIVGAFFRFDYLLRFHLLRSVQLHLIWHSSLWGVTTFPKKFTNRTRITLTIFSPFQQQLVSVLRGPLLGSVADSDADRAPLLQRHELVVVPEGVLHLPHHRTRRLRVLPRHSSGQSKCGERWAGISSSYSKGRLFISLLCQEDLRFWPKLPSPQSL